MRKCVTFLVALALIPALVMADDLSANLNGQGGFASLQTSGSSIDYGIIVSGGINATGAQILQGGNVFIDLSTNFNGGSAQGTAATSSANITALNDNTGSFTLRVVGTNGTITGTLVNNGGTTSGGAGALEFSSGTFQGLETGGTATITVQRVGGVDGVVTVDFATADGTAVDGTHYQANSGTLTWQDGDAAEKSFDVTLFDNGTEDGDVTVDLSLSNPTGGADLGLSAAILTVVDDEALICTPGENTLCLNTDGRFKAEVTFTDFQGDHGVGVTSPLALRDSGLFYFFNEDNIEMLVKVIDACNSDFNAYWVFFAATTNVQFDLTVTDTRTGAVRTYSNPLGNPAAPIQDTAAFMTCP